MELSVHLSKLPFVTSWSWLDKIWRFDRFFQSHFFFALGTSDVAHCNTLPKIECQCPYDTFEVVISVVNVAEIRDKFSCSGREGYGELLAESGARMYTSRYVSSYHISRHFFPQLKNILHCPFFGTFFF